MIPVDTYILDYPLRVLQSWYFKVLKFFFQTETAAIEHWARIRVLFNPKLLSRDLWGLYVLAVYNVIAIFLDVIDMRVTFFAGPEGQYLGNLITLLGVAVATAVYMFGFLQKDAIYTFTVEDEDPNTIVQMAPVEGNKTVLVFAIAGMWQLMLLGLQKWVTNYPLSLWNILTILSFTIVLVLPLVMGNSLKSIAKYDCPKIANSLLVITGCLALVMS